MAKRRLAMVSCEEAHSTPWQRCSGEESSIRISGLGQGNAVALVLDAGSEEHSFGHGSDGEYPWPNLRAKRYRLEKRVGGDVLPTTVEISLNANRFETP